MTVGPLPISYQLAIDMCYIEFSLVLFILFSASFVSLIRRVQRHFRNKVKAAIEQYLIHINDNALLFDAKNFPFYWKKLPILLSVVDVLDVRKHNDHWMSFRASFVKSILFPMAVDYATDCHWQNRLYAIRTFGLLRDKSNHHYIEVLVNDRIPLVAIYAGKVALINHSEVAIHSLINRIGHERWGAQLIDLHSFDVYPPESKPYFTKKLLSATEPRIRAACYKILSRYQPSPLDWDVKPDVFSADLELKIAALKFVTHEDSAVAIPCLIDTLKIEKDKRVRLVAVHCLGLLKTTKAIPVLTDCLADENWWIKVSAAEALKTLGPKGVAVLTEHKIDIDAVSYNVNHILNTWW